MKLRDIERRLAAKLLPSENKVPNIIDRNASKRERRAELLGRVVRVSWCDPDQFWGRFGGGWQIKVGVQGSFGSTWIVELGIFSVRVDCAKVLKEGVKR